MINIVVFASGSGTNFQAVIDAVEEGKISGRITGLVVNRQKAGAVERAGKHDIPVSFLSPDSFDKFPDYVDAMLETLEHWSADLLVLAGYLLKIPERVIDEYRGRIINIHPSLLPKYGGKGFYGMKVHEAVIENEEEKSGCTVHYVIEEYDKGPIIDQKVVPVHPDDTPDSLARRVLKEEHKLLPKVIADLAETLNPNQQEP